MNKLIELALTQLVCRYLVRCSHSHHPGHSVWRRVWWRRSEQSTCWRLTEEGLATHYSPWKITISLPLTQSQLCMLWMPL